MEEVVAHMKSSGEIHSLRDHLSGVAKLAETFSVDKFKEIAKCAGMNHDIGKCRPDFQKRIRGDKNIHCEHACCSAQEIFRISGKTTVTQMLAYVMAGHHSGLQDGGNKTDPLDSATLSAALRRNVNDYIPLGKKYSCCAPDSALLNKLLLENAKQEDVIERFAFITRYIYSCQVDADFLDTESFFDAEIERGFNVDFEQALALLEKRMQSFPSDTKIHKARNLLQKQAESNYDSSGVLFLGLPTGSGKTLCSMKIALKAAVQQNKKRIIYVIPYTSIIEQTASVFENIFGNTLPVLQHHSNYSYSESESEESNKMLLSSENWDAPFIITTNVQFFQSLYSHKSSDLRKLHNLADSVIVFDEAHIMPIKYLQPCLRGVNYLTKYLNSQAIFLSATMPNFFDLFEKYTGECNCKDLIEDKSSFNLFDNRIFKYIGAVSSEKLVGLTKNHKSNLIVVNDKKYARELYEKCSDKENVFHLSAYMTTIDRSATIKKIKELLQSGERVCVISTSLIEAGVDLDFEAVYRELAGLDNVIQTAGRCNREGCLDFGTTYVFERDILRVSKDLSIKANLCKQLFLDSKDVTNPSVIAEYYRRLYLFNDSVIKNNSIAINTPDISSVRFRTYSESFNFIETDSVNLIIPCEKNRSLLNMLNHGLLRDKKELQKYAVSIRSYELKNMIDKGLADDYGSGVYQLTDSRYYNNKIGLNLDFKPLI